MPRPDDDGYHNPNCVNFLPIAILLTVLYALPRLALETGLAKLAERRRPQRPARRLTLVEGSRLVTLDDIARTDDWERAA